MLVLVGFLLLVGVKVSTCSSVTLKLVCVSGVRLRLCCLPMVSRQSNRALLGVTVVFSVVMVRFLLSLVLVAFGTNRVNRM